jgi:hypothetical protein
MNVQVEESLNKWISRPFWYSRHPTDYVLFYDFLHIAYLDGLDRNRILDLLKNHVSKKHPDWKPEYTDHILSQVMNDVDTIVPFLKHIDEEKE